MFDKLITRAKLSRVINDAIREGADTMDLVLLLDSVKADLLIQIPYQVLAAKEQEEDSNA